MLTLLLKILIVLVVIYFIRIVFSHIFTWYYFSRYDRLYSPKNYTPPVSVIKPVWGLDEKSLDNFRTFCEQDYPNEYELIFCVEKKEDPCIPVIHRIIEEYPERNIRIIFSDPKDHQSFGKIKNMIAGLSKSRYEIVVFSDTDVHVPPSFLMDAVACLENPEVGLGFSVPVSEGSEDWVAAMLNIAVNETVLLVTPLCLFNRCNLAIGTTMFTRKKVIEEIGGLEQFGRQVSDDIPLARAIYRNGHCIRLLKQPARVFHAHDDFKKWWWHMHRWLVIIRCYFPFVVYAALFTELPLFLSLLYFVLSVIIKESIYYGILFIGTVLMIRLVSTAVINLRFAHDKNLWRFIWVVPVLDILRLPLLIHSYLRDEITWRGRKIRINQDSTVKVINSGL
jgi:ceramide glucosyltransferase